MLYDLKNLSASVAHMGSPSPRLRLGSGLPMWATLAERFFKSYNNLKVILYPIRNPQTAARHNLLNRLKTIKGQDISHNMPSHNQAEHSLFMLPHLKQGVFTCYHSLSYYCQTASILVTGRTLVLMPQSDWHSRL